MTRDVISFHLDDLSSFAKRLRKDIETDLGHAEFLDRISKAAGYRNYQHLRAKNTPTAPVNGTQVARAARYFDGDGRFAKWPARTLTQHLCCYVVWSRLPARTPMTEREISALIDQETAFRDAAQIRRTLIEVGALERNLDGSRYMRKEAPIPPEAADLIKRVARRDSA